MHDLFTLVHFNFAFPAFELGLFMYHAI